MHYSMWDMHLFQPKSMYCKIIQHDAAYTVPVCLKKYLHICLLALRALIKKQIQQEMGRERSQGPRIDN